MYADFWRKLAWATFLGSFLLLLVQQFWGALMNSCRWAVVFPIKNRFSHLTCYFDYWLRFNSAIWLSKMKSLFLNLYTSPSWWATPLLQILVTAESVHYLQINRFPLMKFDTQFECTGSLISKVTIMKSTHLININCF